MSTRPSQHLKSLFLVLFVHLFLGWVLTSYGAATSKQEESVSAMNVILITISTLRADHVTCLGYERDTTPNFDEFAKKSILFRKAFAVSSWMMPTHGSIFTSQYPSMHEATHIDKNLGEEHITLAEILQANGYYCVGFCCNPRLDNEHGFAQGFDLYDDYSVSVMLEGMSFGQGVSFDVNKQRTNGLLNDAAIGWLKNNTHHPFFLFVHYYDNHWDYSPPAPYDRLYDPNYKGSIDGTEVPREPLFSNAPNNRDIDQLIALYDGEVKQTDKDLGDLLEVLREEGLLNNSIVIIMGDHGEQFYEHGHTSHHGLFEELIHVPLAISVPDESVKGKVISSLVSHVDILPTLLDCLHINVPERCHGKSLRPIIEGKSSTVNEHVFAEYSGGAAPTSFVLRSDRYKYYREDGESFYYDLVKDPGEKHKIFHNRSLAEVRTLELVLAKLMSRITNKKPKQDNQLPRNTDKDQKLSLPENPQ